MLSDTIKNLRKQQNLSQEELAAKLHVVRQTVSKWEQGLSVPDADMLIKLSQVFQVPVSVLLGETPAAPEEDAPTVEMLAKELADLNDLLAKKQAARRKKQRIGYGCVLALGLLVLFGQLYSYIQKLQQIESIGTIGGADGPTAIIVTTADPGVLPYVFGALLVGLGIFGLVRSRRR